MLAGSKPCLGLRKLKRKIKGFSQSLWAFLPRHNKLPKAAHLQTSLSPRKHTLPVHRSWKRSLLLTSAMISTEDAFQVWSSLELTCSWRSWGRKAFPGNDRDDWHQLHWCNYRNRWYRLFFHNTQSRSTSCNHVEKQRANILLVQFQYKPWSPLLKSRDPMIRPSLCRSLHTLQWDSSGAQYHDDIAQ